MSEGRPFTTASDGRNATFGTESIPAVGQRYGGRAAGQALVSKLIGVPRAPDGIAGNIVNTRDAPPACYGFNTNNPDPLTTAPLKCNFLNEDFNSDAVKLRLRAELPHLTRKQIAQ